MLNKVNKSVKRRLDKDENNKDEIIKELVVRLNKFEKELEKLKGIKL